MAEGVVSPVVQDVAAKSAVQVADEINSLVELARSHRLRPEHVRGGTFTVSTLGSYGVRDFVALVVPPQVAIMSVGSIHSAPIVKDEQIVVGRRVSMTLSADHRAVDGAMAAEFLISLRDLLENPSAYIKQ
jgi:pyruvate dehydrogenase E2 component (dihydrolipoamide acetyltransferase)